MPGGASLKLAKLLKAMGESVPPDGICTKALVTVAVGAVSLKRTGAARSRKRLTAVIGGLDGNGVAGLGLEVGLGDELQLAVGLINGEGRVVGRAFDLCDLVGEVEVVVVSSVVVRTPTTSSSIFEIDAADSAMSVGAELVAALSTAVGSVADTPDQGWPSHLRQPARPDP